MADVFTQDGEELLADIVTNPANHPGTNGFYVAWGTGGTTAAKGDAALGTEAPESRVQIAAISQPSADVNRFQGTIQASASRSIIEAGVFNAATSGILFIRSDFATVSLNANDSIQFTWDVEWQ